MNTLFIDLEGWNYHGKFARQDEDLDIFEINVDRIVKIITLEVDRRIYLPLEDGETFDENNPDHCYGSYKYVPSCEIVVSADNPLNASQGIKVLGTAESILAKVKTARERQLVADDKAIRIGRTGVIELSDRGTWTADVQYARYDVVEHPSSNEQFLAIAPSKAPAVLILQNKSKWCKLG
ncbi:MAG: hypothetical protein OXG88_01155 [Gammaproteobacteria bacterium]|nr:hypothetical protein [Gammaproteobacteria bacterium]